MEVKRITDDDLWAVYEVNIVSDLPQTGSIFDFSLMVMARTRSTRAGLK